MRPNSVKRFGDILFLAALLFLGNGCGQGICPDQATCPDGSWSIGTGGGSTSTPVVTSFIDYMASTANRSKGTPQKTLKEELALAGAALPSGYRQVPRIGNSIVPTAGDDDAYLGGGVTFGLRPTLTCGTTQSTVADRIAHCALQNPTRASWDGAVNGNGGQGIWNLVTYNGVHEVWRDERTQLLWSDFMGTTNWCRASGSSGGGPFAEVDQFNYCDNAANQSQVTPESWCAEETGLNTPGAYDSMKGGMRLTATATSPSVAWRLPTMNDYQLANVNGLRFPKPMLLSLWTASVVSDGRNYAFTFWNDTGGMYISLRDDIGQGIRCVGR